MLFVLAYAPVRISGARHPGHRDLQDFQQTEHGHSRQLRFILNAVIVRCAHAHGKHFVFFHSIPPEFLFVPVPSESRGIP